MWIFLEARMKNKNVIFKLLQWNDGVIWMSIALDNWFFFPKPKI